MAGSKYFVADGAVGTSGKPTRVYSATWLSDGTARDLVLRNGTSDSGTVYTTAAGVISKTATVNFEGGMLFPNGCFLDIGSATSAVITYDQLGS